MHHLNFELANEQEKLQTKAIKSNAFLDLRRPERKSRCACFSITSFFTGKKKKDNITRKSKEVRMEVAINQHKSIRKNV